MVRNRNYQVLFGVVPVLMLASGCAHKYENPITKDTQQPDKVLFDTAEDLHGVAVTEFGDEDADGKSLALA